MHLYTLLAVPRGSRRAAAVCFRLSKGVTGATSPKRQEIPVMNKLLLAVLVASLGACATSSPDVVHPYQTQRMAQVLDATVLNVRPVTVDGSQSGVGAG